MTTLSYILFLAPICEKLTIACIIMATLFAITAICYIVYMCGGFNYSGEPKGTSKKWPVIYYSFIHYGCSQRNKEKKT